MGGKANNKKQCILKCMRKRQIKSAPLKSLEDLPDDFNRGGTPKKRRCLLFLSVIRYG